MGCLMNCGVCCMLLSIWAVIQLALMGVFYKLKAVPMISDVISSTYTDYDDLIKQTNKNFDTVALNCWIAAAAYAGMILISITCIVFAKGSDKQKAMAQEDDDVICASPDDLPSKKKGSPVKKEPPKPAPPPVKKTPPAKKASPNKTGKL